MTAIELINSNYNIIIIVMYLFVIGFEHLAIRYLGVKGSIEHKEASMNVLVGLSSFPINAIFAFLTFGALFWAKEYQIISLPITFYTLVICFILDDLRFYIHHRICHRFRWMWGMHVVHHSSERFSLDVAGRQGWTKHFTGTMMLKVPLVLIGFDPLLVIFCGVINAAYQFFLHTEAIGKLPRWYEFIFNTPSHHRVHHGKNPKYLDANYAGSLIIWDRMFGSFVEEDLNDQPDFGLVEPIRTYNPFKILFFEYVRIFQDIFSPGLSIKERVLYLFGPPGWSHDGTRKMSTDIKHLDNNKIINRKT